MKNIILTIGICLLLGAGAVMAEDENGGYAGAFLQVPLTPRAAAMGNAYIAVSDDAAGMLHNPAGLTAVKQMDFTSAYRAMQLDRQLGYVSFIFPTRMESSLGVSWIYAGSGEVQRRNNAGVPLGGTISSNDHAFAVSFSKQFLTFLGAGARLNYYYKTFDEINANTIGINIGVMFSIDSLFEYGSMEEKPINDIKAGLIVENLASSYSWEKESSGLATDSDNDFPVEVGLGISFKSFQRSLLLAADVRKNDKQDLKLNFGGEYRFPQDIMLRAGLNDGTLATGAGFRLMIGEKSSLDINYAFSLEKAEEGSEHIFGLSFRF